MRSHWTLPDSYVLTLGHHPELLREVCALLQSRSPTAEDTSRRASSPPDTPSTARAPPLAARLPSACTAHPEGPELHTWEGWANTAHNLHTLLMVWFAILLTFKRLCWHLMKQRPLKSPCLGSHRRVPSKAPGGSVTYRRLHTGVSQPGLHQRSQRLRSFNISSPIQTMEKHFSDIITRIRCRKAKQE